MARMNGVAVCFLFAVATALELQVDEHSSELSSAQSDAVQIMDAGWWYHMMQKPKTSGRTQATAVNKTAKTASAALHVTHSKAVTQSKQATPVGKTVATTHTQHSVSGAGAHLRATSSKQTNSKQTAPAKLHATPTIRSKQATPVRKAVATTHTQHSVRGTGAHLRATSTKQTHSKQATRVMPTDNKVELYLHHPILMQGKPILIKMKKKTPMKLLVHDIARKFGFPESKLALRYNNQMIGPQDTIQSLRIPSKGTVNMEVDYATLVAVAQSFLAQMNAGKTTNPSQQYMMLVVKKPNGEYLPLQLKRNAIMGQVLATVCKAWNIPMDQAQLYRHNAVVPLHETAMNLHLEDQETVFFVAKPQAASTKPVTKL